MNLYYPAFLRLAGRPVLLVGGGTAALQQAIALGEAGARITVIAPVMHPDMRNVPGVVRRVRRAFQAADLDGLSRPWLTVAASGDDKTDARVVRAGVRARVWVGLSGRPVPGSFLSPAVVRLGTATFAVSTGGSSPLLSRFLAARLGTVFGPEIGVLARLLGSLRPKLKTLSIPDRKKLIEAVLFQAAERDLRPNDVRRMEKNILDGLNREID